MIHYARCRNQAGGANSAEFAVALTVFFFVILFPLINLIGFATAACTQYLLTKQCVSRAGSSSTYADALTAMDSTSKEIAASGLGQFAKLSPVAGFSGSGTNLFVVETPFSGSSVKYGPNTPYAGNVNIDSNVYEYQVRSTFDVGPFISMAGFPFVGDIPGVGRPARLNFVASEIVEFSEGLAFGGNGNGFAGPGTGGGGGGAAIMMQDTAPSTQSQQQAQ